MQASDSGVAAWIGDSLTLINGTTGAAEFSGKMGGNILSARLGPQYAAVVLEPEHDSTIVLMESGGRRVDSITLSGKTVIDYGFFNTTGDLFWVMTLDTTGTAPSCTLSTYRPGKRIVGQITDSVQAVSYTHLDVYKRQVFWIISLSISCGSETSRSFSIAGSVGKRSAS